MRRFVVILALFCMAFAAAGAAVYGQENTEFDGLLRFEDGMAMPMLNYSELTTPNEESEILRFVVYVETDYDTDDDGWADLVKVFVQVPRSAAEGKYKAAVIYDPTPYSAGMQNDFSGHENFPFSPKIFDYDKLYQPGLKREVVSRMTTLEAVSEANPGDWIYSVPRTGNDGYPFAGYYDYFLVRGFAVVQATGLGTYGSDGFELCGLDLEREAHKNVIEWLTGDRVAFTDNTQQIGIAADWCNGNVAMTGTSYGGTLPFEVAVTGVKGLKTIIPFAGISSWYDYSNSQGIPLDTKANYNDTLAVANSGGLFEDDSWLVPNDAYGAFLWQIAADQIEANGNFAPIWEAMEYADDWENINCSALIVHGLNDYNVLVKQSVQMYRAFRNAGQDVKLIFSQEGHNDLYGKLINEFLFDDLMNLWLSHYLYDMENGITDMENVLVQSNVDGIFYAFSAWETQRSAAVPAAGDEEFSEIQNKALTGLKEEGENPADFYLKLETPDSAVYDVEFPAGETIYGPAELHVRIATEDVDRVRMMVTAVLIDTVPEGESFKAYLTYPQLQDILPVKTVGYYEIGGGHDPEACVTYVPTSTDVKVIAMGWTDLRNPGLGYDSTEYLEDVTLEAGKYYDYTIYFTENCYTVQEGHTVKLVLMASDPLRVDYDPENNGADPDAEVSYSFMVDNGSLRMVFPLVPLSEE